MPSIGPQVATRYNRASVERALSHHLGEQPAWRTDGKGGYTLSLPIGIVRLRTLREAAIFVYGAATVARRTEEQHHGS